MTARSGEQRCIAHRACSACGTTGAPNRSPRKDGTHWCNACLQRYRRNGSPEIGKAVIRTRDERFDSYLGPPNAVTGCIPWTGTRTQKGYGRFRFGGRRSVGAHRYALERALGRPLESGMQALHHCDNTPCCNPAHLYEGTHDDNMVDKVRRNRSRFGVPSGRGWIGPAPVRRFTDDQVQRLRERYADGMSIRKLAAELEVGRETVGDAIAGRGAYRDV